MHVIKADGDIWHRKTAKAYEEEDSHHELAEGTKSVDDELQNGQSFD